jgi:hypothetical protein
MTDRSSDEKEKGVAEAGRDRSVTWARKNAKEARQPDG